MDESATTGRVHLASLFLTFLGISAFTLGGGYAMVPVINDAAVKRGWLREDEFWDLFARAQAVPGPFGLNMALSVGAKVRGFAGLAVCALAIVLPPFFALIAAGSLLAAFGSHPVVADFMEGAGATIPGFVLAMIVKMSRARAWNAMRILLTAGLAVALILLPSLAIPLFFAGAFACWLTERAWKS
jgi:chromate transporter